MYGLAFGIISIFIFLIWVINYIFTKKSINKYLLSFWLVSFFIALFLWISSWFNLIEKYSDKGLVEKNYEFQLPEINTWILDISLSWISENTFLESNYWQTVIRLEKSDWQNIKLKIETYILWNQEIVKKVSDWMSDIKMKNEWNKLIFYTDSWKVFKQKVPFSLMQKYITLYLPESNQIKFLNNFYAYFENVSIIKEEQKYSSRHNNCLNSTIFFSKEEDKFVCKLNEEDLKMWKKSYLTNYIISNFDDISPILHNDDYKREYYNNFYYENNNSDWNFKDFKWEDDYKNVEVIFWDMSLKIKSNINLEETSTWVIINDFKIENISLDDDNYDEKYYKNVEIINNFIK